MKTVFFGASRDHQWIKTAVIVICMTTCINSLLFGKGGSQGIPQVLLWYPVEALVLTHFDVAKQNTLVIEKSYYGQLQPGDEIALTEKNRANFSLPPTSDDQKESHQFLLFLVHKHLEQARGYELPVGSEWSTNSAASRRIADGKVYSWSPRPFNGSPVDDTETLAQAEPQITYGLSLHEGLLAAKAAQDPQAKLDLLRPYFVPSEDGRYTPYMVWQVTASNLDEADKAGAAAIPFYEELLKLPCYQSSFDPDGWIGFGAQERRQVEQRLQLQKAHLENDPAKKLADLTPLFGLQYYEYRAGADAELLLTRIMDKALAETTSAGTAAIPFLQDLLTRPYFQDSYLRGNQKIGHERRQKIEDALARFQLNR